MEVANAFPFESGDVGYAFKRHENTDGVRQVDQFLSRLSGFDPCFTMVQDRMRRRTFSAHWVNLLDDRFVRLLGGIDAIASKLPDAELRRLERGVLIRGRKVPPIGDANNAPDVGRLPDVARLLRPTRVRVKGFGEPTALFDADAWLARFDKMASGPWDNEREQRAKISRPRSKSSPR